MNTKALGEFAERYRHAHEVALRTEFEGGTTGLELEWNIVDSSFRPLHHVGAGPDAVSFADALRLRFVPPCLHERLELEVFHWMTEWTTRPYYHPVGTVYEGRILEGCLLNALGAAGLSFGERLYATHGNLLWPIDVNHQSIPGGWELSKRRYLERCVDLFGGALATAGMHSNVSLPEPLLSLDFVHQSASRHQERTLREFANEHYVRGARVLRAFAALFTATSAASPLRAERRDGTPVVRLTEHDSNRLAVFPNPPELDVPDLYRSHADYVRISHDLVRRRVRFGNNNWTPTRARSDRPSVDRIIHVTSDQLHDVYRKGIYRAGEEETVEQVATRIEIENLIARVDIPMSRVEIRCDEAGHDLDLDVANLALRELLLMRTYADPAFGAGFDYTAADVARARRNETAAAHDGLRGTFAHPFTAQPVRARDFLRWTLEQVDPLARALDRHACLEPLRALAGGAPNTAERLRARLRQELGPRDEVPLELLRQLAVEREEQTARDLTRIVERLHELGDEAPKLRDMLARAREAAHADPTSRIRFDPPRAAAASATLVYPDKTAEILDLAQHLIRIPSVTNCPHERLPEVHRAGRFIAGYLRDAGLDVHLYDADKYPAVLAAFPGGRTAPVMLSGHFDVVEPSPDDSQFEPVIEGDYLWGRGSADMKTVVATYLVWMRDRHRAGGAPPPINLLLVGNEENGEAEPTGTPHVLAALQAEHAYAPQLMLVGERTGERGDELFGEICNANRGVVRMQFVVHGPREHTGVGAEAADLLQRLIDVRTAIARLGAEHLTLDAADGWKTECRFAFLNVGTAGVYNITPGSGHLGLEVRPIPEDDLAGFLAAVQAAVQALDCAVHVQTREAGVCCPPDHRYLLPLRQAVRELSGSDPVLGRKKPGTSGRFAPGGQAVIWGQSGIGPHSPAERHFIPSIAGHYAALDRYAHLLAP